MSTKNKEQLTLEIKALKSQIRQLKDANQAVDPNHAWTPSEAVDLLLESIKFHAEVPYNGDYRSVDQSIFERRVMLETLIDKAYYFINGKGPTNKQSGCKGRVEEKKADANQAKRLYGDSSPQFKEAFATLKAATYKLKLLEDLDLKVRMRHEEINNKGHRYMAFGEQRIGNAPTGTSPKNRVLTPAEMAEYQELGISIDLDSPANAIAQREHMEVEDSIQTALAAAANS